MAFSKKGKGIVAISLVLSAVAPQAMGAQAISIKGIKESFTAFFLRTFYFWYIKRSCIESYIENLEAEVENRRKELLSYYIGLIKKTKNEVSCALKSLGYEKDIFLDEFQLTEDVLKFIKIKNEENEKKQKELEMATRKIVPIHDLSKVLQVLKECCDTKNIEEYYEIVDKDQNILEKAFKCIFKGGENKYFARKNNTVNDKIFLKNAKGFISEEFIPKLKKLILSKAKEQNYIENNSKYDDGVFEKIFEKSEKDFLNLDKQKCEFKGNNAAAVGAVLHYSEDFRKAKFLGNLNLKSDEGDDYLEDADFIEDEREFNHLLKNLRALKRDRVYYTGDLGIFYEQQHLVEPFGFENIKNIVW